MANIKIAVINESTVVANDDNFQKVIAALQKQVHNDFAPIWGIDADLRVVPNRQAAAPGEWWLLILDNSDQAGALGYHDITPDGLPLGKVFAKTDLVYHENWTCTTSHELLEMLADPAINLTVFNQTRHGGRLYAYEVCDACEAERYGYKIDGVLVSDFVCPAWFEAFRKHDAQFDYMHKISAPFQLLPGGYIGYYDVLAGNGWKQETAETQNMRARAPVGSRRERRSVMMDQRVAST